jgi:hypothetical protein
MKITVDTGLGLRYYQNIEGDSMDRLVIKGNYVLNSQVKKAKKEESNA